MYCTMPTFPTKYTSSNVAITTYAYTYIYTVVRILPGST